MIKNYLVPLLRRGMYVTDNILIDRENRDFVTDLCAENDYVPVFSYDDGGGYICFRAIQLCPC